MCCEEGAVHHHFHPLNHICTLVHDFVGIHRPAARAIGYWQMVLTGLSTYHA